MKKNVFVVILISVFVYSNQINAQTNVDSLVQSKFIYCELVGTQKFLSTKVTVSVDFGQERSFFSDIRLRDEQTGKLQSFNSMVDALNYMGSNGWEFVQAYIVSIGDQNVYHWLLKKRK